MLHPVDRSIQYDIRHAVAVEQFTWQTMPHLGFSCSRVICCYFDKWEEDRRRNCPDKDQGVPGSHCGSAVSAPEVSASVTESHRATRKSRNGVNFGHWVPSVASEEFLPPLAPPVVSCQNIMASSRRNSLCLIMYSLLLFHCNTSLRFLTDF